jgi:uncharacterized protein with GYD domain
MSVKASKDCSKRVAQNDVRQWHSGDYDVFGIADMPDNVSSVAFSMMINASGVINAKTTVLLTPEEIDQATKKTVDYRPPGQ